MTELNVVLLCGQMTDRNNQRSSRDFVLSKSEHGGLGATATAAGVAGVGGNAIGLVSTMGNSDEMADYVTMELDDKHVTGWFWDFPFCNGDELEVVAEKVGNSYSAALSARRPRDGLIAILPHCTRGRGVHLRKSLKYWLYSSTFLTIGMLIMYYFAGAKNADFPLTIIASFIAMAYGIYLILAIPIFFKFMKFVRIAETCFKAYGWPDIKNIDLYATSKRKRQGGEPTGYGRTIYRY